MNFGYGPESADVETENAFWEYVRGEDFESEPTTILDELTRRGWLPPHPDDISGRALSRALERLILDLSWLNVYLHATNHLADRELYEQLVEHVATNEIALWPEDPGSAISISFISRGTDEEHDLFLRYYADEKERNWWAEHYPQMEMPPAELPPYPRPWIPERPAFD